MNHEEIVRILYKVANKQAISIEEEKLLDEWLEQSDHNRRLFEEVSDLRAMEEEVRNMVSYDSRRLWKKVKQKMPPRENKLVSLFQNRTFRFAAAAVILLLLSAGVYFLFFKPGPASTGSIATTKTTAEPDIAPGTQKAILTLDDGSAIVLDSTSNDIIAQEGTTTIVKKDDLLSYNTGAGETEGRVYHNTLSTPRGGFYPSLLLADGSRVWLDAQSSIRYPTAFTGNERIVEVTGQVYMEVAKNASKPFKVNIKEKGITVEVLGTHFNINAYNDETAVNTTLLEGAVKVVADNGKNSRFLKPGQQASTGDDGKMVVRSGVDIEAIVAWKNGRFVFREESIQTIMRHVGKWYGVEVVYEDTITGPFGVTGLPRDVPLSKLLTILSATKEVKFEIKEKEKRVIVRR